MEKKVSRAVIMYLYEKGMKTKEIHDYMVTTIGEDSPCYSTVKKLDADLSKSGKAPIVTHGERTERPKSTTTDVQVEGVRRLVMNDRRLKNIAQTLGISFGDEQTVCQMVTQMLTPDQKLNRLEISRAILASFQSDPAN